MTALRTTKPPQTIEIADMDELEAILERARVGPLREEEHGKLKAAIETLAFLTGQIEDKQTTISKLRKLLFGSTTERTDKLFEDAPGGAEPSSGDSTPPEAESSQPEKQRPAGHGRNGAQAYRGAKRREIRHESLAAGDPCPVENCKGRVSRLEKPARLVRIRGVAPLQAELTELERLRCNLCGMVFTAKAPEGLGEEKYDATAVAMMAILRYGAGLPLHRLERLQGDLGIPLPASTQWDVVSEAAPTFASVYEQLIRQAAQGKVLHNDDTNMTILQFLKEDRERRKRGDPPERSGVYTSGIVSVSGARRIVLFFTGRAHAGENLTKVLAERDRELDLAIQMCDALSRNISSAFATIVCNCMSHARRNYVDVVESFPEDCRFLLETLAIVFKNDATARKEKMSDEERLAFHRRESKRAMAELRLWMARELRERRVEPNSGLGKAMAYMRKHWRKLTRFLFVAGAPLHNNICERILKMAIAHRKNSLFYKTERGARVGDIYMSLIATCQLAGANPFEYLSELGRHADDVTRDPARWLPWTYQESLARIVDGQDRPDSETAVSAAAR